MKVISDQALREVLSGVTKDDKLTPAELKKLEKLKNLPDDRFETPPNGNVWRDASEELASLLSAKPLVTADLEVTKPMRGITLRLAKDTSVNDEDAGGGFIRVYERNLSVKIDAETQPRDGSFAFTYGGYKVTLPVKKGDTRDQIVSKLETRLMRQQNGAMSVGGRGKTTTFGIHQVRDFDREGKNERRARIAIEDSRWLHEVMGPNVNPADFRPAAAAEKPGSLAARVSELLRSSSMSATALKQALADAQPNQTLDQDGLAQLTRIAVQPRARVDGDEGGAAYDAMEQIRGVVGYTRPILAAKFELVSAPAGVHMAMTDKLQMLEAGEDEGGPIQQLAKKLTVRIDDDPLKEGGKLAYRYGGKDYAIELATGMSLKDAKQKIADAIMLQVATSCSYGNGVRGVDAVVTRG